MNYPKAFAPLLGVAVLAGCGNADSVHLVFGQQNVVGLDITASAPEQGGSLSLGFKDKNIAVIPVAVESGTLKDGSKYKLLGSTNKESADKRRSDAYSTLGQFELNSGKDGSLSVGLGKFFATGIAAQKLAEGFQYRLGKKQKADEGE